MEEDDGVAYIAMQFVNGPTLDEVMSRPKPMARAGDVPHPSPDRLCARFRA